MGRYGWIGEGGSGGGLSKGVMVGWIGEVRGMGFGVWGGGGKEGGREELGVWMDWGGRWGVMFEREGYMCMCSMDCSMDKSIRIDL